MGGPTRTRQTLIGFAALTALAVVFGALAFTLPSGSSGTSSDLDKAMSAGNRQAAAECQKEGWRVIPVTKILAIHPDGTQGPAKAGDTYGRAYYFADGSYSPEPPPGFTPLDATDQELKAYGFEARPADPALMDHWRSLYANYRAPRRGHPLPVECQTNERS